ncbi:uncharacterized protein C8Q71DRAFT_751049 [Rhodofomes roseus]|uniref:CS domain-containing protein n=1 Tax=Rhodofomes roseus TaxID=34475 RepID=A0ABQ8KJU5_9APHY|nr:uncharacterized protein C8Q71DRAFT_751049 [Rhodofomes roseus]KAH9838418.1 hypothetical protein C8Q71DRAFT_751049 [Rhodofomes roseus]
MDRVHDYYQSYSWHQSHDQATVLLLVPYETAEDDVSVVIERNFLMAGVRGQPPIVKGRLYGNVDTANSVWQLEPQASRTSARERTTSTTSTASQSTHSSFAVVSDPGISSSFAASLENGLLSDLDDPMSSPALSSPVSSSLDEHGFVFPHQRHPPRSNPSYPASPGPSSQHNAPLSLTSSYSSVESLHRASGRLLTLHLEKAESVIWPSLVVGPVPESLASSTVSSYPWASSSGLTVESTYNMDPTSLVLIALDLYDIRESYEEAFEYFVRAWHQARVPSAAIRLATHYLPVQSRVPDLSPDIATSTGSLESSTDTEPTTPTPSIPETSPSPPPTPGTLAYYLGRIGGTSGLADLFLSAGILHLEGAAAPLLSSAYAGLSSLRTPLVVSGSTGHGHGFAASSASPGGTEGWRRDRECARRYFERARALVPSLDVPLLPPESDSDVGSGVGSGAENGDRRSTGTRSGPASSSSGRHSEKVHTEVHSADPPQAQPRRRRKRETSGDLSSSIIENYRSSDTDAGDEDRTWYLYVPGLVGAGAALLVVGFLSLSSWRKSQGGS